MFKSRYAHISIVIAAVWLLHARLLSLPFFWDEAGYYIPAARDLYLSGSLVPNTTLHTAHTPLLSIFLAVVWKLFGYGIAITRIEMLLVACFGLWQVYRLAENVSNRSVALAATSLTALYPVVFAQSTLAHADLLATAMVWWGLREYFLPQAKAHRYALAFTLAVLAKETTIVVPFALAAFETIRIRKPWTMRIIALCAAPSIALTTWFIFQHAMTGSWFGDPSYYRYNVSQTLAPLRIVFAFAQRCWQAFGHMSMWLLTFATGAAMLLPPEPGRQRIPIRTQCAFATVILGVLIFHSIVGGALLTRYLLPIFPLIIMIGVSTWWRRVPRWEWLATIVGLGFFVSCYLNPPYRFAPEDNLNYADFVRLHRTAAREIEQHYPSGRVLTAWPASDELRKPELGYVSSPRAITVIKDFSADQITHATSQRSFEIVLAFSTKYEPPRPILRSDWWLNVSRRFFDYHRDLTPDDIAASVAGRVTWRQEAKGQWIAIIFKGTDLPVPGD